MLLTTVTPNSPDEVPRPQAASSPSRISKLCSATAPRSCRSRFGAELPSPISRPMPPGVTVHAGGTAVRSGWLVGCDGGRSTVRKLASFEFPGTNPEITGYSAMVEIADPRKLSYGWKRTAQGTYVNGPMPGRILTVDTAVPEDRNTPVTLEELQTSLRKVSGTDVTITAVHAAARWTDNARQATTYRLGRVLLAGDAAHVHAPIGGQGLNLGLGDAVNLGWKLAATVNGWAPETLLDTYTTERHPIGAWALKWTRAQVAVMRPKRRGLALTSVVADLIGTGDGATNLAKKISGVWQRYDLPGDHPLVGQSAPDLEFEDGRRLGNYCHDAQALLFNFADDARISTLGARWRGRLTVLTNRLKKGSDFDCSLRAPPTVLSPGRRTENSTWIRPLLLCQHGSGITVRGLIRARHRNQSRQTFLLDRRRSLQPAAFSGELLTCGVEFFLPRSNCALHHPTLYKGPFRTSDCHLFFISHQAVHLTSSYTFFLSLLRLRSTIGNYKLSS